MAGHGLPDTLQAPTFIPYETGISGMHSLYQKLDRLLPIISILSALIYSL
jgi:hypothetical protein